MLSFWARKSYSGLDRYSARFGRGAHLSPCAYDDLVEISDLVRSTCDADDEVHALFDRFDAGLVSIEKLKDEIRALTLRH